MSAFYFVNIYDINLFGVILVILTMQSNSEYQHQTHKTYEIWPKSKERIEGDNH